MLPGDPLIWVILTFVLGVFLAFALGLCLALPIPRKLEYITYTVTVIILAGVLFWALSLDVLIDNQGSCLNKAETDIKSVTLCLEYGYSDATELTILASGAWFMFVCFGTFIGFITRIAPGNKKNAQNSQRGLVS